jgi:hypothetical protein
VLNSSDNTNVFLGLPKRQLTEAIEKLKVLPATKEIAVLIRQLQLAMKTKLILCLVLLCGLSAAQNSAHKNTLNWGASPDASSNPAVAYNVYRATGPCPLTGSPTTLSQIGSTLAGIRPTLIAECLFLSRTATSFGQH